MGLHQTTPNHEAHGLSSKRLEKINAAMQAEIDQGRYAGISLMIARSGSVILDGQFGYQNLESKTPLNERSIFRIASMTKPVIGVALMSLYEDGRWQLDDPLVKFIPEFSKLKVATPDGLVDPIHPITMRELVTSTAGFAAGFPLGSSNLKLDEAYAAADLFGGKLVDMIYRLAELPLESQPGCKYRYGVQHDLQGFVVERIAGQPLDQFLTERLFAPLGMHDTGFGVADAERSRIATLYTYDGRLNLIPAQNQGAFFPGAPGDIPEFLSGGAGLYSTMANYMRFLQMVANEGALEDQQILSPATVRLMTRDFLPTGVKLNFKDSVEGVGYGAGFGIILDPGRASFNGGPMGAGSVFWTGAHGTWFWIDPEYDLIVLGMAQQEFSAALHMGIPHPAPDLRALSRSLTYQALTRP